MNLTNKLNNLNNLNKLNKLTLMLAVLTAMVSQAAPTLAQVPWDMVPTSQVAPEYNQAQYQSPTNASANPANLNGYSIAAPQNTGGINPSIYMPQQTGLNSGGAAGSLGNTTFRTNGWGVNPTQTFSPTGSQNQNGLNLPHAGTMGLAPVFGTGNDGFTSPGGYDPLIYIPGLGSYRLPTQLGLPGGGSLQLPNVQQGQSILQGL